MEYFAIFIICAVSGVFTGLLGIGGGLIIMPAFLTILPFFGIRSFSIHEVVGISATCVFFNSMATLFYRRKEQFLPKKLILGLLFAIAAGTALGAYFSSFAPKKGIVLVYLLVSALSLVLMKKNVCFNINHKILKPLLYMVFGLIGALSATIGIGGAIMFSTALQCFLEHDTKELLPSVTLLVGVHALVAFAVKFANSDVTLFVIPIAVVASVVGSKIGVMISEKLSSKTIKNLMFWTLSLAMARVGFELFTR